MPTTAEELQSFIGFVGFYRRFIKHFSKIARPLHDALQRSGIQSTNRKGHRRRSTPVEWNPAQQGAFDKLIEACTTTPVLAFADFKKSFKVYTDASLEGLGSVLYQEQDGRDRVIAYASRRLSKAEKNYPVHKQEFLALKWAVTEKFADYLIGSSFTAFTDNNPLTYVLGSAKLDATGHRWVAQLANFNFDIKYRCGKANIDADPLSRIKWPSDLTSMATAEVVDSVLQSTKVDVPLAEVRCFSGLAFAIDPANVILPSSGIKNITWSEEQRKDVAINILVEHVGDKPLNPDQKKNPHVKRLLRHRKRLIMKDNVLCRQRQVEGEMMFPMILPPEYHNRALKGCHDEVGHMGRERTLSLLRDRFYWSSMSEDTAAYIAKCDRCLRRKAVQDRAALVNITTTQPLEMLCIDFLSLEPSKGGVENVLVVTDHFTRYAQAFPTRNQKARTTARILFENYIIHYGFPARFHSDMGRNFESATIKHLCRLAGIEKSCTTPYHPMANGQVERFNRKLLDMLGTMDKAQKTDWKKYVPALTHAYNSTRHESTGYSPFFLMFGRHPRLPVDLLFRRQGDEAEQQNYTDYVAGLRKQLEYAYSLASSSIAKSQLHNSQNYNKKVRGTCVEVGDRVLVRNVGVRGKHKIADRWEEEVFVVLGKPNPEIPVYTVKQENGKGRTRVLHRNLLLPINHVPPAKQRETLTPVAVVLEETEGQVTVSDEEDIMSVVSDDSDIGPPLLRPRRQLANQPPRVIEPELVVQPPVNQPVPEPPGTPEVLRPIINIATPIGGAEALPPADDPVIADDLRVPPVVQDHSPITSSGESEHESPPPRRSRRNRQPPDRYSSDTYQVSQQRSLSGLEQRVAMLRDIGRLLLETGGSTKEHFV